MTEDTKPSATDEHDPNKSTQTGGSSPEQGPDGADAPPSSAQPGSAHPGSAHPGSEGPSSTESPDPLAQAQTEAARLKDQLLRTAADFDNFRKRTRRELEDAERTGRDDLLRELLPVFDNLERATAHGGSADATTAKALVDGIELVMRQFTDTLRKVGIERVPSIGHPFDPSVHEAIQHLESAEFSPGTIAAEVQAGYRSAQRLVRPALVVVAKAPASPPQTDGGAEASSDTAF